MFSVPHVTSSLLLNLESVCDPTLIKPPSFAMLPQACLNDRILGRDAGSASVWRTFGLVQKKCWKLLQYCTGKTSYRKKILPKNPTEKKRKNTSRNLPKIRQNCITNKLEGLQKNSKNDPKTRPKIKKNIT